jgi:NAD(P)-dependent dehydrogenase (short-subunit alcohol dehydrogenase family)
MKNFKGGTAVITGAGSGFGLEASRIAARLGMNVVMADVQQDALEIAEGEIRGLGVKVLPRRSVPRPSNSSAPPASCSTTRVSAAAA